GEEGKQSLLLAKRDRALEQRFVEPLDRAKSDSRATSVGRVRLGSANGLTSRRVGKSGRNACRMKAALPTVWDMHHSLLALRANPLPTPKKKRAVHSPIGYYIYRNILTLERGPQAMAGKALYDVLRHIGKLAALQTSRGCSDRELLERFLDAK